VQTETTLTIDFDGPLSAEQIAAYRDSGYLAVNDVLSAAEMQELREVTDEFIDRSRAITASDEVFDLEPDHSAARPRLRRLKDPERQHEAYDRVLRNEKILGIVSQLVGESLCAFGSKLNIKESEGGSPVEWHQDWAFFPHTNDDSLALGVPLDDMSEENGCLMVVPGSHKGPIFDHHQDGVFVGAVDPSGLEEHAVPIELRSGGISMHHVRTLHGSAPNLSPRPRRLLLFQYVAADAWPLVEGTTWETMKSRVIKGTLSATPRLTAVPVRLPYPRLPYGSIFDVQSIVKNKGFQRSGAGSSM
jgi:ectoine hydroxylase-related dioxygenase (phytanoyl-CoA dioxygenase family)